MSVYFFSFLFFAFFFFFLFFNLAASGSRVSSPQDTGGLQKAQLPACLVFTEQAPLTFLAYHTIKLTFIKLPEMFQAQAKPLPTSLLCSSGALVLLIDGVP